MDLHFFERLKKFSYEGTTRVKLNTIEKMIAETQIKGGFNVEAICKVSKSIATLSTWVFNYLKAGYAVAGVAEV